MTQNIPSVSKLIHRLWDWIKHGLKYLRIYIFPKSLLYRFILIILLPLLILQIVMIIFFYDRHWDTVSRRLASDIVGEINMLIPTIENLADKEPDVLTQIFQKTKNHLLLDTSFLPQTELTVSFPHKITQVNYALDSLLKEEMNHPYTWREESGRNISLFIQLENGVLKVNIPRKRFFSSTIHVFLVWMIGSSILLFWIAFLFMKNQVRAIERLSKASELFGTGHHSIDFKPEGATEVRQAGHSFILMRNRIYKYIMERTEMLAGVSHDLRTPLTRMKLQLSMMPQNEQTTDLLADIAEMEEMLNGYLAFTKGEDKTPPEPIDLNEFLRDLSEKAQKTGQQLDFHAEEKVMIKGRPNDLRRALMNLITNAGRYAHNTQIKLGVRKGMACIFIDDDGPGIPQTKQKDVFKAFFRLDKSRNSKTGGIGLGLTISKDIILSHGGDIQLSNKSALGGLRVIVYLPKA